MSIGLRRSVDQLGALSSPPPCYDNRAVSRSLLKFFMPGLQLDGTIPPVIFKQIFNHRLSDPALLLSLKLAIERCAYVRVEGKPSKKYGTYIL